MDLKWGADETAGKSAIRDIKASHPEIRIIAVTAYENLIADARRAGADVALLKTFTREDLLLHIRELAASETGFPSPVPEKTPPADLSPREREVLTLLAEGLSTREIAGKLFIAENTARNHITNILSKLGVNRRTQAVKLAHKYGMGR